jgi:predicted ArsR family transcriptional regulator
MTARTGALEAVGHPVRLRILDRLGAGPASITELAEAAGVHENTARAHVAALEQGELVLAESRPPSGPGRPGVQYRLTPEGERLDQDFLGLAELLAAVVSRSGASVPELREIGKEWGRYLVGRPGRFDLAERVPAVLRRLGFEATVAGDEVRLTDCPCPLVSSDRPELICALASGVLDGVLAAAGNERRIAEEIHDPAARDCRIILVEGRDPSPTGKTAGRKAGTPRRKASGAVS